MEEYTQMTLSDWMSLKDALKQDILSAKDKLNGLKKDFVRIGYKLRQIEDGKLYEKDGYKSIAEFAKTECGLTGSDITRFMQINERYSVGGYSEELRPEFLEYGQSKLAAMLALPDTDLQMIEPAASRENIRELGRFNKTEPVAGVADDIRKLIEKFYEEHPEILNEIFSEPADGQGDIKKLIEVVNPGGNRSFKKGLYFLMMYENKIVIKKFGDTPTNMTWEEFFEVTQSIFRDAAAGPETWQNYFGGEDAGKIEESDTTNVGTGGIMQEENSERTEEDGSGEKDKSAKCVEVGGDNVRGISETDKINDEPEEQEEREKSEEIPGQMELTKDMPEYCPDSADTKSEEEIAPAQNEPEEQGEKEESEEKTEVMNEPEIMEKPFGTRKDYIDTLTAHGFAQYLAREYNEHNLRVSSLAYPSELEKWLLQEVDDNGRNMEEE